MLITGLDSADVKCIGNLNYAYGPVYLFNGVKTFMQNYTPEGLKI